MNAKFLIATGVILASIFTASFALSETPFSTLRCHLKGHETVKAEILQFVERHPPETVSSAPFGKYFVVAKVTESSNDTTGKTIIVNIMNDVRDVRSIYGVGQTVEMDVEEIPGDLIWKEYALIKC